MAIDAELELRLRKLLAERDVARQLYRYHEAFNRADYDEMEAFFGDAKIATIGSANPDELHGVIVGGAQWNEGYRNCLCFYDGTPMVQYTASNVMVDVNDALDEAKLHAYYTIFQALGTHDYEDPDAPREFALQPIGCGRYYDTYRSIGGRWQLVERKMYSDLSGDYSRHLRISPLEMAEDGGLLDQVEETGLQPTVDHVTGRSMFGDR